MARAVSGAVVSIFLIAWSAWAAEKPPTADRLKALEREAEESKARAAALARDAAALQKDIDAQREKLTEAAAAVQEGEETLSRLEKDRAELAAHSRQSSEVLTQEKARLAGLTAGLVRLVRVPRGGLLAWPGAPVDAARGEMLLEAALGSVRMRTREVQSTIADLDRLSRDVEDKRRAAEQAAADLKSRRGNLAALIEQRQLAYRRTDTEQKEAAARAEKIAADAKDLRDLMAKIEAQRAVEAKRAETQRAAEAKRSAEAKRLAALTSPVPKGGKSVAGGGYPVAGDIRIAFGQKDGLGATSRGLTLATRPGAAVISPASGVVRFAGPFRSYREILILEHPDGYHSLIAGMARIDVAVGDTVGAGEPVGSMDDRSDARPELYYELRRNGEPVDPADVLSRGLKGKAR